MAQSILNDVKQSLGLDSEYDVFDLDIIMHINSILSDLHQLGIGPDEGFEIVDDTETWTEYLADDPRLNNVKSYMYLRVKLLFDPPGVGYVVTAMEKQIDKAEWRINLAREEIQYPPVVPVPETEEDIFADG